MSKKSGMLDELMNWLSDGAQPDAEEVIQASDMAKDEVIEELKKKLAMEQDPEMRAKIQRKLDELNEQAVQPDNLTGVY